MFNLKLPVYAQLDMKAVDHKNESKKTKSVSANI